MRKWGAALAALSVFVSSSPAAAEAPCRASEARAIVRSFVEAFNRGDTDVLDRMWAQEPDFFWFFDGADAAQRSDLSEERAALPLYFRRRALLGDQLHLRELGVRWQRGWHAAWGVSFELHRVRTSRVWRAATTARPRSPAVTTGSCCTHGRWAAPTARASCV